MLMLLRIAARLLWQGPYASTRTAITYANDIINKIYRVLGWPLPSSECEWVATSLKGVHA